MRNKSRRSLTIPSLIIAFMKTSFRFLIGCALLPFMAFAQQMDTSYVVVKDSMQEVVVHSFHNQQPWVEVAGAVAVLNSERLQQIGTTSLLPALNTVAGVRMEERSPGSIRLAMRGSLLRSPFGVRNLKVYWNSLPLTDGGGNTYLNLVDAMQISSVEIVKGPAASMYGAGTGGLLLLTTQHPYSVTTTATNTYQASLNWGSFGGMQAAFSWNHQAKNNSHQLMASHQQSDGYRQQSALSKDHLTWTGSFQKPRQQWNFLVLATRLQYQTPGGITLAQMEQNPKQARQAAGGFPSATTQQTGVINQTILGGIHQRFNINKNSSTVVALVFSHTDFRNPFITNYELRDETNAGINAQYIYQNKWRKLGIKWVSGGEWLGNRAKIENDGNRQGRRDTVQFIDRVNSMQWFLFSQVQLKYGRWQAQLGVSANNQAYQYKRLTDGSTGFTNKQTQLVAMPRFSMGYAFHKTIQWYGVVSKGFSPPSLAEIKPASQLFNTDLQPEFGLNWEMGLKGELLQPRLHFGLNVYRCTLQQAIVGRNNPDGSQYFVNAGSTRQNGLELTLQYQLIHNPISIFQSITLLESYTYQPYRFNEYQQANNIYSGNKVTGIPEQSNASGLQVAFKKGFFVHVSYQYTGKIPLTDANDVYAKDYHLLQTKIGWVGKFRSHSLQLFLGGDNLLNETYSLGNDINAAGKRYYNPAPTINGYGRVVCNW